MGALCNGSLGPAFTSILPAAIQPTSEPQDAGHARSYYGLSIPNMPGPLKRRDESRGGGWGGARHLRGVRVHIRTGL